MSTEEGSRSNLTPEQQDLAATLRAMLNAYDSGSDELRANMMNAVKSGGKSDFVVPAEDMARGYAVEAAKELPTVKEKLENGLEIRRTPTQREAARQMGALDEAGQKIPGVRNLIDLLARRGKQILGRGQS